MATRERSGLGVIASFRDVVRFLLIGVFTGVETVALVVWLELVREAPLVSRAAATGLAVLLAGLLLEHFLTDLAVNGIDLSFPLGKAAFFSASEALLWALWLGLAERFGGLEGVLIAGGVLAVLLVPQHSIEDGVLRGKRLFSNLLTVRTAGFSLVEAAGATVWLVLVTQGASVQTRLDALSLATIHVETVGVVILAVFLFVEHIIGVRFSRRE